MIKTRFDGVGLAGLVSTVLAMVGTQIILLCLIALAIGPNAEKLLAWPLLAAGIALNVCAIRVWRWAGA